MKIGFIGQGWIGKNYSNDFEQRGYNVIRYALEEPYVQNKDLIRTCDIVFIAVPTPTTVNGFDSSIVEKALELVGNGKTAVVKSTILPGTTENLQRKFPNIFVFHSPEFLREIYAGYDAANPVRNIIGIPVVDYENTRRANEVLSVLPKAKYEKVMRAKEAELVKYIGNCFLYEKVVFFNQMFDVANKLGLDYQIIRDAVTNDPRIGDSHTAIAHASGHKQNILGRGAGGDCFIKDFEAMISQYKQLLPEDTFGIAALEAIKEKNYSLLVNSQKDLDLLQKVAGNVSVYQTAKRYLVTGAAGFIGFAVCKKLLEQGHLVVGIDNINDYYDVTLKHKRLEQLERYSSFKFLKIDFSDNTVLFTNLKGESFDSIIHLGAQAGVRYSIENPFIYAQSNYVGTLNIFELAKQNKIPHVVYASTSSVYGKNEKQPFEESDLTDTPLSTYAATKKATEVLAHSYSHLFGLKVTGLRFFTVYGPWGRPDMALFKFVKNILEEKPITIYNNGEMSRSFTYIDDIVDGILGSLNVKEKYSLYNLGGDTVVPLMQFVETIERKLGKSAIKQYAPMQAGDVKDTVASSDKSGKDLGYRAKVGIDEGVDKFVQWFIEHKDWLLKLEDAKQ